MQNDQVTVYGHNFTVRWVPMRLLNSWVGFNAGAGSTLWHEPAYAVTPDGWLCFRGLLTATAATSDIVTTLPREVTPRFRAEFAWAGYNSVTGYNSPAGTVQENGTVYIQAIANQSWVSLENTRVWLGV